MFDQRSVTALRSAYDGERERLSHVLAAAFLDLPPTKWLLPDDELRRACFPAYARIWVDHGLDHGTIDVVETAAGEVAGLSIWSVEPDQGPSDYRRRLVDAVGERQLPRFCLFDAALLGVHPQHEHFYLAFAAVAPEFQGNGYGASLLQRRHAELDANGVPAYLVAASGASRRLYLRHGYQDQGSPIRLPGGPAMYPMWRAPRPDHRSEARTDAY